MCDEYTAEANDIVPGIFRSECQCIRTYCDFKSLQRKRKKINEKCIAVGVYYVSNASLYFNFVQIIESFAHEVIIIAA